MLIPRQVTSTPHSGACTSGFRQPSLPYTWYIRHIFGRHRSPNPKHTLQIIDWYADNLIRLCTRTTLLRIACQWRVQSIIIRSGRRHWNHARTGVLWRHAPAILLLWMWVSGVGQTYGMAWVAVRHPDRLGKRTSRSRRGVISRRQQATHRLKRSGRVDEGCHRASLL